MNPTKDWGLFSPVCIWVERRLGDERQRMLAKRLVFVLLVTAGFVLAYDAATLPLGIETIWSRNLSAEITHVSGFEDEDHGEVIAVALADDSYGPGSSTIALLDRQGREIGGLGTVPTTVCRLLYLPTSRNPTIIIGLPSKYVSEPSYIIRPNVSRFEMGNEPGFDQIQEPFSPGCMDSMVLEDGRTLVIGFSPNGPPYLVALAHSGHHDDILGTLWVKKLRISELHAGIMKGPAGRDPVILVTETNDVLAVYDVEGSRLWALNLTEHLLSTEIFQRNARIRCSVDGEDSVFGKEKAGIFFQAYQRGEGGWGPHRSFFLLLDSQLHILDFWEDAPPLDDPIFISSESKILTDDICLNADGGTAWIRRGSWNRLAADLVGDGGKEVISVTPGLFRKGTVVQIFNKDGRFLARGTFPGEWGDPVAVDLSNGEKQILYYAGADLRLLQIRDTPYLPRLALETVLFALTMAFLLYVVRTSWPPKSLRKVGLILTMQSRKSKPPRAGIPSHYARLKHEEYRICECGERNPINTVTCSGCGKRFRRRRKESIDLSVKGRLSRIGLAAGSAGLLIHAVTPAVWSVEPSGSLHALMRSVFVVVSPTVPYTTWISAVVFVLALTGVCLIYLERSALTGGVACLVVFGVSIYLSSTWMRFSLFPFILIGICGILQPSQKMVMARKGA